jgi:hypothetical protein
MDKLDQWLKATGEDGRFDESAAVRLDQALAGEDTPRRRARRRDVAASAAFALVAGLAGATMGAALEVGQASASAPLLPASQQGTVAALFPGER